MAQEFGSLVNLLSQNHGTYTLPEIGSGATICGWTDRYAGTVIEVDEKRRIVTVQQDDAKRIDNNGMSECQEYEYTQNPDGPCYFYRWNKDNSWTQVFFNTDTKRWNNHGSGGVYFGRRERYFFLTSLFKDIV